MTLKYPLHACIPSFILREMLWESEPAYTELTQHSSRYPGPSLFLGQLEPEDRVELGLWERKQDIKDTQDAKEKWEPHYTLSY